MKKINSLIFKTCFISFFCMSTQLNLAENTASIIIKKDNPIPPTPIQPSIIQRPISIEEIQSEIESKIYFYQ